MCLASMLGYTWIICHGINSSSTARVEWHDTGNMLPMHIDDEAFILVVAFWVKYIPWIYLASVPTSAESRKRQTCKTDSSERLDLTGQ